MKKFIFIICCCIFFIHTSKAQREISEDAKFSDRLYFGGGLGFSSSGNATVFNLSPTVGYMFTNQLSGGIGIIYQYVNYKSIDLKTSNYGGRLFGRYNITPQLFGYTEYEVMNYEYPTISANGKEYTSRREISPSLFLGAGYYQPFGRRGGVSLMLLYNVIYDENKSPYPRPYVIRAGFNL